MEMPPLPERDPRGNRPVGATVQVLLARRIIRARHAAGLSRRELAQRAGIAPHTLTRIEAGEQMPRPDTVSKLTAVLGEI